MRRTLLLLCAAFAASATGAAVSAAGPSASQGSKDACAAKKSKWDRAQCESFSHSAPGDEYFGRLKMSYLGINNTFRDEAIRAGAYTTDGNIINKVHFADDALQDWERKYPNDPQLARSYFLGENAYKKIYTRDAQDRAYAIMKRLVAKFPTSYFGKTVKKNLAVGFTEHYFALPETCPTPLPPGVVPQTTPSATATPSPRAGEPKVQVIVPPCVPPATPTPSPTPMPSGMPSASPGALPSAMPSASPTAIPSGAMTPTPMPTTTPH